jgi:hypothetical protein
MKYMVKSRLISYVTCFVICCLIALLFKDRVIYFHTCIKNCQSCNAAAHSNEETDTHETVIFSKIPDFDISNKISVLESLFESTIRNCLGKKCYDITPPSVSYDRVGILGTPGSGIESLEQVLSSLISVGDNNPHLIFASNVPAYGYGKNHGWSRIIRIVRSPIQQSQDLLKYNRATTTMTPEYQSQLFGTQVANPYT